jgi:HlyD family secretion protein
MVESQTPLPAATEHSPTDSGTSDRLTLSGFLWGSPLRLGLTVLIGCLLIFWIGDRLLGPSETLGMSFDGQPTVAVKRGPLTISFTERGSVKAANSEQIINTLEGSSTIVSVVAEGMAVSAGDVLVELDSSSLTQEFNQQAIKVKEAESSLTTAEKAVEIQEKQNESDISAAELAVELARIDLEKYTQGEWPLSVETAKAQIFIAREDLRGAQNKYAWTEKLAQKGYVTGLEVIKDDLAVKRAKVQVGEVEGALKVLQRFTRQKDIKTFESAVQQTEQALERTKIQAESMMVLAVADRESKAATLKLSRERLAKIEDQLEKTRIRAPEDGMVVYHTGGRWGRDDRMIEQGATVRENQHLIDLPDLSVMAVEVAIPEARVHTIRTGMPALVTVDAQTDANFSGKITKIGLLPDQVNRWMNPDLKVYKAEVTIDPGQNTELLRPGMSSKVEIMVAHLDDVTYVPVQSVTTVDGEAVVYRLVGGDFAPAKVTLGLANDSFLVIESGLEKDELALLNAPRPTGAPPAEAQERREAMFKSGSADGAAGGGRGASAGRERRGGRREGGVGGGEGRRRGSSAGGRSGRTGGERKRGVGAAGRGRAGGTTSS